MASLLIAVIYVAFISLGLPDGLLGAAWPTMSASLHAPLSWAGGISMVIAAGTIISALLSDRMTLRFGAAKVTAVSVALTACALLGTSMAPNYWILLAFAIPYGLGAGGVDAALNNYVAVHYASKHMSWLHCMWGLGALIGPYVMGFGLTHAHGWQWGYRAVGIVQIVLTAIIVLSIPLWSTRNTNVTPAQAQLDEVGRSDAGQVTNSTKPLRIIDVLRISGAPQILIMFFCYCAVEQSAMLWASSYMVSVNHISLAQAAQYASLLFIGITVGRFLSGFLTMKLRDTQMIRLGFVILLIGIACMVLPVSTTWNAIVGFIIIGLGCAPIYPCVIHSTPTLFGADRSQAIVGVQMACAYTGTMFMPPLFGVLAQWTSITLLPWYLLFFVVLMVVMHEWLLKATTQSQHN